MNPALPKRRVGIERKIRVKEIVFVDIDTQVDFMLPKGKLYVPDAQTLIPNLRYLTRSALENDILIVSSVDAHIKNDPEFKQFPAHCVVGSKGQRKIPQTLLKRHISIPQKILSKNQLFGKIKGYPQLILEKNTYDIFSNFNLLRLLKPFKVAFVYGVALDYCVKYAVLGLLQAGLKVNLVIDATRSVNVKNGRRLLAKFEKNGVKLIRTEKITPRRCDW